jgi:signal peptidase II
MRGGTRMTHENSRLCGLKPAPTKNLHKVRTQSRIIRSWGRASARAHPGYLRNRVMVIKSKFFLITSVVLGIDLLSKYLVGTIPSLQGRAIIPHYMHISLAINSGIFFHLLDDFSWAWKPYLLAGLSLIPVFIIFRLSGRRPAGRELLQTALAFLAGGLLGNSVDRILHGAIIDFIEVHFENSIYYPTFNIADLAITAGIVLLAIHYLKYPPFVCKQGPLVSERDSI